MAGLSVGPSMMNRQMSSPAPRAGGGMGLDVGRNSLQGILPSATDPFRTYASVQGGNITPPSNPYAPPSNLPTGGGAGTWEGGGPGPINSGPTNPLQYMQGGGFTGGQMPPGIQSGSSAASEMPQIVQNRPFPNMPGVRRQMGMGNPNPSPIPNMPPRNPMQRPNRGFRGAYGGGDDSSMNSPFKRNLFY